MPENIIEPMWVGTPPSEWPSPPAWMSFTDLRNIETCPRRWSLSNALYPDLWSRRGYPPKFYVATICGQILHVALELITQALRRKGCDSVDDERFVGAMRELGGYSKVIEEAVSTTVNRSNQNPRFASASSHLIPEVRKLIPSMRESLQVLVSKLRPTSAESRVFADGYVRGPLSNGTYTEIEVRAPKIEWHGFIDVLTLSESRCEIVDFKSGRLDPTHEEQLKIYSLLWARDTELNPHGRIAESLILSYSTSQIILKPLTRHELDVLEQELIRRTTEAFTAIRHGVPVANPTVDNCRFCSVRQICDEYWLPATQARLAEQVRNEAKVDEPLTDVEIEITEQESSCVWRGIVTVSRRLPIHSPVLIQVVDGHQPARIAMQAGRKLRLIDVMFVGQDDDKLRHPLITLGKYSEAFLLN